MLRTDHGHEQPRAGWGRSTMKDTFYTVTQLADELGMTARAVRFYEQKGLIQPQRAGSTRVYTERERARLILVQRGKRLGFSIQDIKEYLDLYEADRTGAEQLCALLRGVRKRIKRLEDQSAALALTLEELRDIERQATESLEKIDRNGKDS
ncbi:MerR family transcriptional regulator [Stappia sp. 22II-S9-Z10]|nr:MerR family transcriptional regulator [Stappia sp. 22II-S9-Z10]